MDCCSGSFTCKENCVNIYTKFDTPDWFTCGSLDTPMRPSLDFIPDGPRCGNLAPILTVRDCSSIPKGTTQTVMISDGVNAPYRALCVGPYVLLAKVDGWTYDDPDWTSAVQTRDESLDLTFVGSRTAAYTKYKVSGFRLKTISTTTPSLTGVWKTADLPTSQLTTAIDIFNNPQSAGTLSGSCYDVYNLFLRSKGLSFFQNIVVNNMGVCRLCAGRVGIGEEVTNP